ncbi:hypothetical protein F4814DRAFT_455687 [Daldinia grandis]|nr:hypothetical protein F4814DRAFT_455687 [Daldinia grandis]
MIQTWKPRSIFDDDQKGMTPLSLAIISGHHRIIDLLLSNGLASPNAGNTKLPALHLAIAEGKEDIVELLLQSDEVDPNHYSGKAIGHPPLICAPRPLSKRVMNIFAQWSIAPSRRYNCQPKNSSVSALVRISKVAEDLFLPKCMRKLMLPIRSASIPLWMRMECAAGI